MLPSRSGFAAGPTTVVNRFHIALVIVIHEGAHRIHPASTQTSFKTSAQSPPPRLLAERRPTLGKA